MLVFGTNRPSSLLNLNDANNGDAHQLTFSYESGGTKTDAFTIGRNSSTGNLEFQSDINNHGFEFCHAAAGTQEFNVINMDVGIGTTAPSEKLTVKGNISADGSLSASGAGYNYFNGRVGIGTVAPTEKVGVDGSIILRGSTNHRYKVANDSNNNWAEIGNDGSSGQNTLEFFTKSSSVPAMSIDNDDRVGIGITSPAEQLTVCGNISASGTIMGLNVPDIGTGTAGYITKWEDSNTIGNSIACESGTVLTVAGSISSQGYCGDVNNNTVFGSGAFSQNLSGACNIAIGAGASFKGISSFSTVAIGASALYHNWGGATGVQSGQTAVGACALLNNTSGCLNAAVGYIAMCSNTSGWLNAAFGAYALFNNTTGGTNTAIGATAMYSNTTGNQNTGLGYLTMYGSVTGSDNTQIGYINGGLNSNASFNTAVGACVLYDNTLGCCNSILGTYAMIGNTIGYRNVAIGHMAGSKYKSAFGDIDAREVTNSIHIGANTCPKASSDNNTIVIGHSACSLGSNTVVLGNDNVTTTALRGCVGIGTTIPTEKLTIAGNLTATGDIRSSCGTVEGKILYARSCVGASLMTAQYLSNLGEACIQSGKSGCVRIGTSQGWAMTLSANPDNVPRVGIGGTLPGNEALSIAGNLTATGGICTAATTNGFVSGGRDLADIFATAADNIDGSGTTCYVPNFTDSNTIANSPAYFDSTQLRIGGSLSATGGVCTGAITNGFVSAGRDLADIFATSSGNVDGSGTTNYIPVWSDSDTLDNSPLSSNSACVNLPDSGKLLLGANNDLQICHSGTTSLIRDTNTSSDLVLQGEHIVARSDSGDNMIHMDGDGAVQLYYNNSSKLATTNTGVDVTGTVTSDGHTITGDISANGGLSAYNGYFVDNVEVAGGGKIYVNRSDDTYIDSDSTDRLRVVAGGHQMMVWDYDTGQRAVFGNGTKVYIGDNDNALPEEALTIAGNLSATWNLSAAGAGI